MKENDEVYAYWYQLELVEGLAPGIQPHENAVRNKTDQTNLINKMNSSTAEITYWISQGRPMNSGNDTIPSW